MQATYWQAFAFSTTDSLETIQVEASKRSGNHTLNIYIDGELQEDFDEINRIDFQGKN